MASRFLFALTLLTTSAACRQEASKPPPEAAKRAEEPPPSTQPVPAPAPPPTVPAGSPVVEERALQLAVYTPNPVSPALLAKAEQLVKRRLPGLAIVHQPAEWKPPGVLLATPGIEVLAPPSVEQLAHLGRGLDEKQAHAAAHAHGVLAFGVALAADPKLAQLRVAQEVARDLAREAGGFIWDEDARELYSIAAWTKDRLGGWQGDLPDVRTHFAIHYYETDGRHRAVTVGLGKLGLPDLVVPDVPVGWSDAARDLIDALAQLLLEGAALQPGGRITVDFKAIRHAKAKAEYLDGVLPEAKLRTTVELVVATPEEGDADNRLWEIRFGLHPGATELERQGAALTELVGSREKAPVLAQAEDPELAAVQRRVQARLPQLAAAFRKGLPPGDHIVLKAPFNTDDGGVEWMWIEVTSWNGPLVHGVLENDPLNIKSLQGGARVNVKQALVADYVWARADGSREGGESEEVLRRRH